MTLRLVADENRDKEKPTASLKAWEKTYTSQGVGHGVTAICGEGQGQEAKLPRTHCHALDVVLVAQGFSN